MKLKLEVKIPHYRTVVITWKKEMQIQHFYEGSNFILKVYKCILKYLSNSSTLLCGLAYQFLYYDLELKNCVFFGKTSLSEQMSIRQSGWGIK